MYENVGYRPCPLMGPWLTPLVLRIPTIRKMSPSSMDASSPQDFRRNSTVTQRHMLVSSSFIWKNNQNIVVPPKCDGKEWLSLTRSKWSMRPVTLSQTWGLVFWRWIILSGSTAAYSRQNVIGSKSGVVSSRLRTSHSAWCSTLSSPATKNLVEWESSMSFMVGGSNLQV